MAESDEVLKKICCWRPSFQGSVAADGVGLGGERAGVSSRREHGERDRARVREDVAGIDVAVPLCGQHFTVAVSSSPQSRFPKSIELTSRSSSSVRKRLSACAMPPLPRIRAAAVATPAIDNPQRCMFVSPIQLPLPSAGVWYLARSPNAMRTHLSKGVPVRVSRRPQCGCQEEGREQMLPALRRAVVRRRARSTTLRRYASSSSAMSTLSRSSSHCTCSPSMRAMVARAALDRVAMPGRSAPRSAQRSKERVSLARVYS